MKHNARSPVVILGGGPTGLGSAYMLNTWGCDDWVLYEKEDATGGLSRSFRDEHGYTWDIGGHVTFSHYGLFTNLLDHLVPDHEWVHHDRESWIRMGNGWIPYPFQNNIHRLDRAACAECIDGLIRAATREAVRPKNFKEFIEFTFGEGISRLFMKPYNSKVWDYPLEDMDYAWIGDRVSVPDVSRVARNIALRRDDVAWGPNNRFRFPKHGGTGGIWSRLTEKLPRDQIITGVEAISLDSDHKVVRFSNGEERHYGTLISTIPLDRLTGITGRQEWVSASEGLKHSAVHVIGVALHGRPSPEIATKCWMYFPEATTPFFRVTHFSLYSPHNVDDINSHWSLMAEVSDFSGSEVDPPSLVAATIQGLERAGLIRSSDVVAHTWYHRAEYAYPIPTLSRDGIVNSLLPDLMRSGILSRGRFGAWLYEVGNMDHSFMQGFEAAAHVLFGAPELTVWHPHLANTFHPVRGWDHLSWRIPS